MIAHRSGLILNWLPFIVTFWCPVTHEFWRLDNSTHSRCFDLRLSQHLTLFTLDGIYSLFGEGALGKDSDELSTIAISVDASRGSSLLWNIITKVWLYQCGGQEQPSRGSNDWLESASVKITEYCSSRCISPWAEGLWIKSWDVAAKLQRETRPTGFGLWVRRLVLTQE